MTLLQQVKQYAIQDLHSIISKLNRSTDSKFKLKNISYDEDNDVIHVNVVLSCRDRDIQLNWRYSEEHNEIFLSPSMYDILLKAKQQCRKTKIESATYIYAADDDDFFDDEDGDPVIVDDEDTISDDIDALSDSVDDLKDSVDDIQEDDVDIEIDNNIENHYIAECDNCHGVFISAVIESDQDVTAISGICPLCEKESEQNLKWVIKSVDK